MEILRTAWEGFRLIATASAAGNLAIGAVLVLRDCIPPEESLRQRVGLLRDKLIERVNKQLHALLSYAVSDLNPSQLRDTSSGKPDLVADHTSESMRVAHILGDLGSIELLIRRVHTVFIATAVVALVSFVVVLAFDRLKPLFGILSVGNIALQICALTRARQAESRLRDYERAN